MSRWRCSKCKYIIDNNLGWKFCPECEVYEPCDEWPLLDIDESERLFSEQELKKYKEWFKQCIDKLKEMKKDMSDFEVLRIEDKKLMKALKEENARLLSLLNVKDLSTARLRKMLSQYCYCGKDGKGKCHICLELGKEDEVQS